MSRLDSDFGKEMVWWIGVVELRSMDELVKIGRCKVRIFGYHDPDKTIVPTDLLPWAYPVQMVSGLISVPKEGEWVLGFFADGLEAQQPVVVGILPTHSMESVSEQLVEMARDDIADPATPAARQGFKDARSDEQLLASPRQYIASRDYAADGSGLSKTEFTKASLYPALLGDNDDTGKASTPFLSRMLADTPDQLSLFPMATDVATASGSSWSEPELSVPTKFPFNHVLETESKHALELDDTPDAERVRLLHRTGSQLQMLPDGSVVEKIVKDRYGVVLGTDNLVVFGSVNVTVLGDCNLAVGGNCNKRVEGDYKLSVGGEYQLEVGGDKIVQVSGDDWYHVDGDKKMLVDKDIIHYALKSFKTSSISPANKPTIPSPSGAVFGATVSASMHMQQMPLNSDSENIGKSNKKVKAQAAASAARASPKAVSVPYGLPMEIVFDGSQREVHGATESTLSIGKFVVPSGYKGYISTIAVFEYASGSVSKEMWVTQDPANLTQPTGTEFRNGTGKTAYTGGSTNISVNLSHGVDQPFCTTIRPGEVWYVIVKVHPLGKTVNADFAYRCYPPAKN